MSTVSVVVVSHNSERFLARCLDSVVGGEAEVIVVDNASDDGSADLVRSRYPQVRLIALEENSGYGSGNNVGIAAADSEYVLVLNPDAWALEGALERLVGVAEATPWAGVVGPRLLSPSGAAQQSVRGFPTVWRLATEYWFLRWLAPWSSTLNAFYGAGVDQRHNAEVDWVVGAAILVRRTAFEEVGGFDTSYFMYDDEVDLCMRMRTRGWQTLFTPHAEFVHVGGGSSRPRRAELHREQLRSHIRFVDKHHGRRSATRARRVLLGAMRLRSVLLAGERRRESVDAAAWLARHDVAALLDPGVTAPEQAPTSTPTG